jgi:hypothetical protein
MLDLLTRDAGVSSVVDLLDRSLCPLPCFLGSNVAVVSDPARRTNVLRTDISNVKTDLAGKELETKDEGEGHNEEKAEQGDAHGSSCR